MRPAILFLLVLTPCVSNLIDTVRRMPWTPNVAHQDEVGKHSLESLVDFVVDLEISDVEEDAEEDSDAVDHSRLCIGPPPCRVFADAQLLSSLPVPWSMRLMAPSR